MDVENLAKELILKNMTPEQQMAVLDSVRSSVAQAKEVQKRKIGENVDLVVQALKKIESDIRSRFDDVGNAIEKRVSTIQDGRDGINGKDGRDGKDGRNGRDGAKGDKGERGQDGVDGINGVDGVSVTNANIDFDGSLIITLSSGIQLNVGEVVAPDLVERIKVITNGGGTAQFVLDTLTSLQTQINNLIPSQTGNSGKYLTTNGSALSWATIAGSLSYLGTWNASTNTPTLTSSVGTNGIYYIVDTAGSTNLNGITDWQIGDWLLFNGSVWQKIDQSDVLQSITSTDGSVTVTTTGSTADLSVAVSASTTNVICLVRNSTGATLTKGTAVYINGATGQNPTVTKAQANNDTNSAQTLGLMSADLANNSNGYVTIIGLISNIDTSAFTDGQQLYLSPTTAGTLTATKPYAPQHLVYVAVVEHAHPTQGKLFVKVQNGYEMDELHNVSAQSPTSGQTLIYNASTSLWEKANLTAGTGISVSNGAGSITVTNTGVTSITATSPVASSGGATPAISLASGYGDTQNPFASKTANFFLAAPNGSAGVPTFRAVVAADIPTLNQNTTGTSAGLSATLVATSGGTGQSSYAVGDLIYASTTTALSKLADVATGNALISGGVGVAPSYGKIGLATHVSGTLPVASGGTGGTTSTGSGAVVLATSPTIATPTLTSPIITGSTPQVTTYGSGSGTYTTPANARYLIVEMVGGGGGGSGGGTGTFTAGGNGGSTTFGSNTCTAGSGGPVPWSGSGGAGGSITIGTGTNLASFTGAKGGASQFTAAGNTNYAVDGGGGGSSPYGGAGCGGSYVASGTAAATNSGSGGGGGAGGTATTQVYTGCGGGAGAFIKVLVNSPAATYSYSVGAAGTAGTAGAGTNAAGGGAGGSGWISVTAYF